MKIYSFLFSVVMTMSYCNPDRPNQVNGQIENNLIGTWKMIYAEIRQGDSLEVKDMSQADFIKIINATHFAFFNQVHNSISGFYGGGGTYTIKGNNYTENLDFTGAEEVKGHRFPFTIVMKGDTLIQSGIEEVKEANIKRNIVEKYIRLRN